MPQIIPMTVEEALVAVFASTLVIFATRAFPFVLFSRREPPRILRFIEKYIPPMVMGVLIVYCLRTVNFTGGTRGFPELASLGAVAILHWVKGNALLSIGGGTALYMLLLRFI